MKRLFESTAKRPSYSQKLLTALVLWALLFLATGLIFGATRLSLPFFDRGGDLFMDFFNSVRDAAQGPAVYTERHVIYPPLANLIFLAFGALVPTAYKNTDFALRESWGEYHGAILALFLYLLLPLLLLLFLFYKKAKKEGLPLHVLPLFLFNLPLLYLIERGNLLLYALPALFFFLFYYHSEKKGLAECSLFALAFAIALKLYPALFALLLLKERRLGAFLRVALYSLLLLLLPSLPFGGVGGIFQMAQNVLSFSDNADGALPLLSYLPSLLSLSLFLGALLLKQGEFALFTLGGATLFFFPALHALYAYTLFLPSLLLLLKKRNGARERLLSCLLPLPLFLYPFLPSRGYALLADVSLYLALVLFAVALLNAKKEKE